MHTLPTLNPLHMPLTWQFSKPRGAWGRVSTAHVGRQVELPKLRKAYSEPKV